MTKLVLILMAGAALASANTVSLYQGGWNTDGPLNLTFTGTDANADGTYDLSELTSFHAAFHIGGSATTWSLTDIESDGFAYTSPSDYFLRADNASYFIYENGFPGSSIGFVVDHFSSYFAATGDTMQVVPEPVSTVLLGACAAGLLVVSSLRKKLAARQRSNQRFKSGGRV
jgi:hypothetical protein